MDKKKIHKNDFIYNSENIIKKKYQNVDFKSFSSNPFIEYQNLIDLAYLCESNVLETNLKSIGIVGTQIITQSEDIRNKIFFDFNWKKALIDYHSFIINLSLTDPNKREVDEIREKKRQFKWNSQNIIPLINIFDNVDGLWEIIVTKVEWNSENIIPYIDKFDKIQGLWDLIAVNTADISFIKEIFNKISFTYFIRYNKKAVWNSWLLSKLFDLDLPLFADSRGSKGESFFQLPTILQNIKISNEALLKYKDFWQNDYVFHTYTYKRGESFTYYRGVFPLYKRLFNNKYLDIDFVGNYILPQNVNLEKLRIIDNNKDYLEEY
ncbi:hypothetical protein [Flavobacterium ajazii]|uniref:hypothetical protein n=1 Tax=Flavobacterium ajazii TaxID=2692318 RepID=UPI0013D8141A|nr:hypothetical protein [Flavobacterium ajazii]